MIFEDAPFPCDRFGHLCWLCLRWVITVRDRTETNILNGIFFNFRKSCFPGKSTCGYNEVCVFNPDEANFECMSKKSFGGRCVDSKQCETKNSYCGYVDGDYDFKYCKCFHGYKQKGL